MKAKKPSEMNMDELLKKQKTIQTIIKILIGATILLLFAVVLLY